MLVRDARASVYMNGTFEVRQIETRVLDDVTCVGVGY